MEDLGEEQGTESKNANLEAGVPGVTMDDYLRNTIRRETLFVKEKGQEIWGWSGGSAGKSQNAHPYKPRVGHPEPKTNREDKSKEAVVK
jgi:hypothetical protein